MKVISWVPPLLNAGASGVLAWSLQDWQQLIALLVTVISTVIAIVKMFKDNTPKN